VFLIPVDRFALPTCNTATCRHWMCPTRLILPQPHLVPTAIAITHPACQQLHTWVSSASRSLLTSSTLSSTAAYVSCLGACVNLNDLLTLASLSSPLYGLDLSFLLSCRAHCLDNIRLVFTPPCSGSPASDIQGKAVKAE
jgi:hypothetical protein